MLRLGPAESALDLGTRVSKRKAVSGLDEVLAARLVKGGAAGKNIEAKTTPAPP